MDSPNEKMFKTVLISKRDEACAVLQGLSLPGTSSYSCDLPESDTGEKEKLIQEKLDNLTISDKMTCSLCGATFEDRSQQVMHYKSDWHRYNLKQKLRGREAINEESFESMEDDLSSISGSESESDDETRGRFEQESAGSKVDPKDDLEYGSYHIEGIGRRHPRVFMRNKDGHLVSVYRAVVYNKKNQPETEEELIHLMTRLPEKCKWLIIMLAGGHFAAAIFDGENIIQHKTFHRYVVRAKRGTVQSARDSQGGNAPKSVGAYIRRHHEAALTQDIKNLLGEWSDDIQSCDRIFLRATGSARQTMFNSKAPLLDKHDTRLRMIPFPTRRPTFNEVKRVRDTLSQIQIHGQDSNLQDHIRTPGSQRKTVVDQNIDDKERKESPRGGGKKSEAYKAVKCQEMPYTASTDDSEAEGIIELVTSHEALDTQQQLQEYDDTVRKTRRKKKKKPAVEKEAEMGDNEVEVEESKPIDMYEGVDVFCGLKNQLFTAVKTCDVQGLNAYLAELADLCTQADIPTAVSLNRPLSDSGMRLLHLACREGSKDVIWPLLEAGADPSIKDRSGSLPYILAREKPVRNEFRKFMGENPDKYDYTLAQVPSPLSEEKEAEKKAKEAERRKAMKKAKNARLKERKEEERKVQEEDKEKQRYLDLSDREKRALAAERRMLNQAQSQGQNVTFGSRCFQCGSDMTGKVPFEYNDNRFCAPACLQKHRKAQNAASKPTR